MSTLRTALLVTTVAAGALTLTGCAAAEPIELGSDSVVLDVRTDAEFAAGHLDGSVNLDLSGGDLASAIPTLDPGAEYVVYCKSGNRSSQATSMLEQAGLEVTDAGSMQHASEATGLEIVR